MNGGYACAFPMPWVSSSGEVDRIGAGDTAAVSFFLAFAPSLPRFPLLMLLALPVPFVGAGGVRAAGEALEPAEDLETAHTNLMTCETF